MEFDLMFMTSASVMFSIFLFIAFRVGMLWRDERHAARRREAWAAMQEQEGQVNAQRQGAAGAGANRDRGPAVVGGMRRAARRRHVPLGQHDDEDAEEQFAGAGGGDDDDEGDMVEALSKTVDPKIGKKKQAKLEAKAEKRAQREAELEEREERKRRQAEREEKDRQEEERLKELEAIQAEKERKEREEKEAREHEAYLAMKAEFSVDQEGFDEADPEQEANLLQSFVQYVKDMKVVNMDELASQFHLKTTDAISRLKTLVEDGTLTGVIDDRGKFIYITTDELNAVAKFINQRGRVSVNELASYSNKLISLEAKPHVAATS